MSQPKFYRCKNLLEAVDNMLELCGEPKADDESGTRARPSERDWRLVSAERFDRGDVSPNEDTLEMMSRERYDIHEIRAEYVLVLNDSIQEMRLRSRIARAQEELDALLAKENEKA